MAGALDSFGHFLLILVGSTGNATGKDLTLLVDELEQEVCVLIVDIFDAEFFETAIFFALCFDSYWGQIFDFTFVSHFLFSFYVLNI